MRSASTILGAVGLWLSVIVGCSESHPPDDGSVPGELGSACDDDGDCREGVCLAAGICSRTCAAGADCPSAPWMCVSLPGRGSVCDCTPAPDGDVACNTLDDDCDGQLDEGTLFCGEACVDGARDPLNCGSCGRSCGGGTACVDGECGCPSATPDICAARCVDLATDVANCGTCGNACPGEAPATAACEAGECTLACPAGFDDCDGDAANGCETPTDADVANCGGCAVACSFAHATGSCTAGACLVGACDDGFGDCDADGMNGCEADLATAVADCGSCGFACDLPGATPTCVAGECAVGSCDAGRRDCDAMPGNGCESESATDPENCGMCGRICPGATRPNTIASCRAAACETACAPGFGDCDGVATNGCERPTSTDEANCGMCGNLCPAGDVCVRGSCESRRFSGETGAAWETIPAGGGRLIYAGYTDYSPPGIPYFYSSGDSFPRRFAEYDEANRRWTDLTPRPATGENGWLAGGAWVDTSLYFVTAGGVQRYDIPTATWSVPLTGVLTTTRAQATHDDDGHVYALTPPFELVTYTIATNSVAYRSLGPARLLEGPRTAWDSGTQLLFLMPTFGGPDLFSFDPVTGVLTPRAPIPEPFVNPTFCSDRSGHLYATGDVTGSGTDVWQYDCETDVWSVLPAPLPFDHEQNGACTVSDTGFLYVTDNGTNLARLPLL